MGLVPSTDDARRTKNPKQGDLPLITRRAAPVSSYHSASSLLALTPQSLSLPPKFTSYRPWQTPAILDLVQSEKRFSLLSAPTGSGKSAILISIARALGARVLYLVVTKALEDQIYNEFSPTGIYDIRGHSNYPCASTIFDDDGEMSDLSCPARGRGACKYDKAVEECQGRDVVTNYAHWISMCKAGEPDRLGHFDLIVLDEAHNAHDVLVSSLSVKLYSRSIKLLLSLNLPRPSDDFSISQWRDWCKVAISKAREIYSQHSKADKRHPTLPRLTKLGRDLSRFLSESEHSAWIVEETPFKGVERRGVILTPVWGRHYAEQYLFCGIPRVILSSATLTPKVGEYLNIDVRRSDSDAEFYEIASSFNPASRPLIYINGSVRVDHRMDEGQARLWMNAIDTIAEVNLSHKGIIHSRSYKRTRDIVYRSRLSSHFLSHGPGETREIVDKFKRSHPPSVLVSPAIEEGFDFPGDECRWQIISKVPFVDSRSPLMQARLKDDKSYGDHLTTQSIIQQAGRLVRSQSDWGWTYIIDDHWRWFSGKSHLFTKWFRAAWKRMDLREVRQAIGPK